MQENKRKTMMEEVEIYKKLESDLKLKVKTKTKTN